MFKGDNYMVPFYVLLVYIFSSAPEDARILLPQNLWNDGTLRSIIIIHNKEIIYIIRNINLYIISYKFNTLI